MRVHSDINVTPLIDIVLVLLIIFIVMVPSLMKVHAVVVPRIAPESKDGPRAVPLVVRLDGAGRLFLQQEELEFGHLAERLVEPLMRQPLHLRKVFLKVHGELPQQHAIAVLDEIRRASELAKRRSLSDPRLQQEGMDTKVVVSLLKA